MLLDGKKCSLAQKESIAEQIARLVASGKRPPHLGVILVGEDPASTTYVNNKDKASQAVGISSTVLRLPASVSQEQLLEQMEAWNNDPEMDGYIVQLPLPSHIDEALVIRSICPEKDVDGFTPENMGCLLTGDKGLLPATPLGIHTLLTAYEVPLRGCECVIIGDNNIVGRPLANLFSHLGITVTLCHEATLNLRDHCLRADIIVTALGESLAPDSPFVLTADMVKPGCVVIDSDIRRTPSGLCGAVDFANVAPLCSYITPVPGGVGPMTIVSLLQNTLTAYLRHQNV